jgi:hypothetical protein
MSASPTLWIKPIRKSKTINVRVRVRVIVMAITAMYIKILKIKPIIYTAVMGVTGRGTVLCCGGGLSRLDHRLDPLEAWHRLSWVHGALAPGIDSTRAGYCVLLRLRCCGRVHWHVGHRRGWRGRGRRMDLR